MKSMLAVLGLMVMSVTFSSNAQAESCEVELVNRRGVVVDTTRVRSRYMTRSEACVEAQRQCRQEKRFRQRSSRRGRNNLTCQKVRLRPRTRGRVGRHNPRYVTRSCTYMFDRRNPVRQDTYHTATETGRVGSGVMARACQAALEECAVKDIFYKGQCIKM